MSLPADSHVHTEWSWDATDGSMLATCRRAEELGLPAVAFTEHVDHTVLRLGGDVDPHLARLAVDGRLSPPAFDATGYLASVAECRDRHPGLRILSGLEIGEPHRHRDQVAAVLAAGTFDRVLGSVHALADGAHFSEPDALWDHRDPHEVVRSYLGEVAELAASDAPFEVLAHIDYPVRSWPAAAGPFAPDVFVDELRHVLGVLAASGRALEVNTRVPLSGTILSWWREEGGTSISFGSDAHDPTSVARGLEDARHLAEATGFRPGREAHHIWGAARRALR